LSEKIKEGFVMKNFRAFKLVEKSHGKGEVDLSALPFNEASQRNNWGLDKDENHILVIEKKAYDELAPLVVELLERIKDYVWHTKEAENLQISQTAREQKQSFERLEQALANAKKKLGVE
jgi:hypothetical protein